MCEELAYGKLKLKSQIFLGGAVGMVNKGKTTSGKNQGGIQREGLIEETNIDQEKYQKRIELKDPDKTKTPGLYTIIFAFVIFSIFLLFQFLNLKDLLVHEDMVL